MNMTSIITMGLLCFLFGAFICSQLIQKDDHRADPFNTISEIALYPIFILTIATLLLFFALSIFPNHFSSILTVFATLVAAYLASYFANEFSLRREDEIRIKSLMTSRISDINDTFYFLNSNYSLLAQFLMTLEKLTQDIGTSVIDIANCTSPLDYFRSKISLYPIFVLPDNCEFDIPRDKVSISSAPAEYMFVNIKIMTCVDQIRKLKFSLNTHGQLISDIDKVKICELVEKGATIQTLGKEIGVEEIGKITAAVITIYKSVLASEIQLRETTKYLLKNYNSILYDGEDEIRVAKVMNWKTKPTIESKGALGIHESWEAARDSILANGFVSHV